MFPSRLVSVLGKGALENNYSLDLDGSNDYVDTGNTFSDVITESHTISAWIKPDDGQPAAASAFLGTVDKWTGYMFFRVQVNGKLLYLIGTPTGEEFDAESTNAVFDNGATNWTHVVATFNKSSNTTGTITLYANGVSVGSSSSPDGSWNTDNYVNVYNLWIGARNEEDAYAQGYAGLIDEVAIYNKALSAGDISALYQARGTANLNDDGNSANLQGWWRFEEGSGTSATDSSTNSNTGTLTNGPTYSTDVPS